MSRADPQLLEHPLLWRAKGANVSVEALRTGFDELDERLPGRGWPAQGLIEILLESPGIGELNLFMPLLRQLCGLDGGWHAWIAPPFEIYAPALSAGGVSVESMLIVKTAQASWAMEQALRCGACRIVFGWTNRARLQGLRRLQLAAEQSRSLGILFRHSSWRKEPSPAVLRLLLQPSAAGLCITVIKSRGGRGGRVVLQTHQQ